ncbi:S-layer domain protein [Desulfofarcimen acetoxidans DSM 771]|uniref:S-layer domain protein n=1 Tax=Desulfofarcimen acetoxidans (strain ATCC 49208 / DSM 771 / KCTC 5769 / VKM B-1644 / 5575) TaxID=485916 RepID=C8W167_DESAS|nr:CbiX/SirB N-terminal domain-containing protein [Desulfofarcimen acetoxidans]ACV63463.1 S-layer domain protein [Desulfofarcimen acetoxidans DSM 771]
MFRSGIKGLAVILLLLLDMFYVVPFCGAAEENIGVLVVAHGSDEASWNATVQQAVAEIALPYPVELGFLEFTEPDIHAAVEALEARGVDKIIAVPLFISSYSNHIEEIKYVLGLRPDLPEAEEPAGGHPGGGGDGIEEEDLTPVDTGAEIVLTPALDDHVMVAGILADRLKTISQNPSEEIAVLVGHGPDTGEGRQKWQETFESLAGRLKALLNLKDAGYGFALMGEPSVRDSVYKAVYQGDVLVVPVMLSEGYFTDTVIPHTLLTDLDYRYPDAGNRALMPHSNIARFIELRVNDVVLPPLEIKKEGDLSPVNYTDVALEEDGKFCVCGSFAFRAMQAALAELWPGEIPEQDRIYVQGPYSDGVEAALERITGSGHFSLEDREQNTGFYNFKVTDKLNRKAVNITVKPEVYPENFFELKKKVKEGTAISEEKQEFQAKRVQLVEKLRWDSLEQLFTLETVQSGSTGILVLAHGSGQDSWNQPVIDAVQNVKSPFPVEAGFLESVPGKDIPTAIRKLEAQGVERIIAVPIFVASASGHIEEIKYMLGLPSSITPEEAVAEGLEPIQHSAVIELTPALDDHILVAGILNDRIASVSQQAAQEVVVLAAHGTSSTEELAVWKHNLTSLGQKLKEKHGFLDVDYGFAAVGEPGLRAVVEDRQTAHPGASLIVMPVMLSEGTLTSNKIPSVLAGLEYIYPTAGQRSLLPHNNISHLISARANDAVLGSLQVKQGDNLLSISYSDVGIEEDGKVCVCGSFAFRAMQVAFDQLWANEVPRQEYIKVIAYNPSDGTEYTLKMIAGVGNYSFDETINDSIYTTPDLYTYRVTNKSTGRSIVIKPGPEVFPEDFFSLKAKVVNGTATAEEKQGFQSLRSQVEEKLRWQTADKILTCLLVSETGSGGGGGGGSSSSRPEVDVYVPAKDAADIAPDVEVSVTFDVTVEAVSDTSLDGITLKDAAGNKVGGVKATLSGKKLSLSHDAFDPGVNYMVNIPSGAVKRQGSSSSAYYNREIQWSFTTGKQSVPVEEADHPKMPYPDVPAGHWAAGDIAKLYREGIMKGYPDGSFKPENNITRAEFTVLLVKAMGWQPSSTGLDFADSGVIPPWAGGSIAAAVENGALSGYEDGTFQADRLINRAEIAVIIVRAMGKQIDTLRPEALTFSDAGAVADWARGYVAEAVEQGIIKGKPGNLFAPGDSATRAEAAAMVARMMENMGK